MKQFDFFLAETQINRFHAPCHKGEKDRKVLGRVILDVKTIVRPTEIYLAREEDWDRVNNLISSPN